MIDKNLNYGRDVIKGFSMKINKYNNVLDIGAGSGVDLLCYKEVAEKKGGKIELSALETHPSNLETLKHHNIKAYNIDLEKEKFPFNDNSLDIVNANQILEHTKEFFWIMHEVTRVLKVGGKFVVGVPNLASFHNRLLLLAGKQPTCIQVDSAHIRGFTKDGFLNSINNIWNGGYQLIDFKGSNFYPFSPFLAKPLSKVFPNSSVCIFLMLEKTKEYAEKDFLTYPVDNQLETNYYLG